MKSILYYTPDHLIEEIIMVSDGNPPEFAYEKDLKAMSPKVRILQNDERMGLIRSKMKAVEHARAQVLVFLEGHCVVNRRWLEPLLERLVQSPRALVQPTLDSIPQTDFNAYYPGAP